MASRPAAASGTSAATAAEDVIGGGDRALVALVCAPHGIPELRATVDLLSDTLLSHLAHEERELVEPITRLGVR